MKRDPRIEAGRWLTQARDEFEDADALRRRRRFYLALFHFQQAAEKALKAFLYQAAPLEEVFFTHSLYELIQAARAISPDFAAVERAARLDEYYIPTRYPNGLPGGVPSRFYTDPEQAREAMRLARMVLELVEEHFQASE
jgi:HEPN domain-containing protein